MIGKDKKKEKKSLTFRTRLSVIDSRMDDHDLSRVSKLFNQFVGAALKLSDSRDAGDKQAPALRNTAGGEIRS